MKFLVVGSPVGHSLSPAMMTAAIRSAGLQATYEAREIPGERWPAAMVDLHAEGIAGLNVTVPHKEGALAGAADATATARAIGAANTLVRSDDGWLADNTDGPGFLAWVDEAGLGDALGREALVLGAGGSARAVVWALLEAGCPRVRIANRTRERAERLAASVAAAVPGAAGRVTVESPVAGGVPVAPGGGLVVNCTSLGLRPDDPSPLPEEALEGTGGILDLVYPETQLVRSARSVGQPAADGLGLLVAQGARSFEIWTGRPADRSAMQAAIRIELDRRRKG